MEPEGKVKRLYKSRTERMIDGVCGGVAEYLGIDPVLVRIAFVLLVFAGGIGVVVYLIGMILMPAGPVPATPPATATAPAEGSAPGSQVEGGTPANPAGIVAGSGNTSTSTARIIGIGFVVLGGLLLLGNLGISFCDHWWGLSWGAIGPILVIAAGVALILRSPGVGTANQAGGGVSAGGEGAAFAAAGAGPAGGPVGAYPAARLYRSRLDRKFLGICGGLGVYLGVDPTILRVLLVISALASFGGTILLYLITAIIIPAEPVAARPA